MHTDEFTLMNIHEGEYFWIMVVKTLICDLRNKKTDSKPHLKPASGAESDRASLASRRTLLASRRAPLAGRRSNPTGPREQPYERQRLRGLLPAKSMQIRPS